jgi:hypothetical protein
MPLTLRSVRNVGRDANRYCGPAAISSVTGMTTGQAARLIRSVTGSTMVTGTSSLAMQRALGRCGIEMNRVHTPALKDANRPTLAAWFKADSTLRRGGRVFLVSAGSHWQLVRNARFVCGLTKEVVPLDHDKVRRRSRVRAVYELTGHASTPPEALAA